MLRAKFVIKHLAFFLIFAIATSISFEAPYVHRAWLRNKVASTIVEIKGTEDGGGGTGFQIEAPSGISYILTNSHVCELAIKEGKNKNFGLAIKNKHALKRRILEISNESDLCLMEGWPGIQGLKLGNRAKIGDFLIGIGHPKLGPTSMVGGEVTTFEDLPLLHHVMHSNKSKLQREAAKEPAPSNEPCEGPKFSIQFETSQNMCSVIPFSTTNCYATEKQAMYMNMTIFPGNSGSPVVDKWGKVVGVVFAANNITNYGMAVNFDQVNHFLADF